MGDDGRAHHDDILETFAVVGEPEDIPKLMLARYGDVLDRISFYAPYQSDPERWAQRPRRLPRRRLNFDQGLKFSGVAVTGWSRATS